MTQWNRIRQKNIFYSLHSAAFLILLVTFLNSLKQVVNTKQELLFPRYKVNYMYIA